MREQYLIKQSISKKKKNIMRKGKKRKEANLC